MHSNMVDMLQLMSNIELTKVKTLNKITPDMVTNLNKLSSSSVSSLIQIGPDDITNLNKIKPSYFTTLDNFNGYNPNSFRPSYTIQLANNQDLNDVTNPGHYRCFQPKNWPPYLSSTSTGRCGWVYIDVEQHDKDWIIQKLMSYEGDVFSYRAKKQGTWTNWTGLNDDMVTRINNINSTMISNLANLTADAVATAKSIVPSQATNLNQISSSMVAALKRFDGYYPVSFRSHDTTALADNTDVDTVMTPGHYRCNTNKNKPPYIINTSGGRCGWIYIDVESHGDTSWIIQRVMDYEGTSISFRAKKAGTWTDWVTITKDMVTTLDDITPAMVANLKAITGNMLTTAKTITPTQATNLNRVTSTMIDTLDDITPTMVTNLKNYDPGIFMPKATIQIPDRYDLNNGLTAGNYRGYSLVNIPPYIVNTPAGRCGWCYVEILAHDTGWVLQKVYPYEGDCGFYRAKKNGTWQEWRALGSSGALTYKRDVKDTEWTRPTASSDDKFSAKIKITHNLGTTDLDTKFITNDSSLDISSISTYFKIIDSNSITLSIENAMVPTIGRIIITAI